MCAPAGVAERRRLPGGEAEPVLAVGEGTPGEGGCAPGAAVAAAPAGGRLTCAPGPRMRSDSASYARAASSSLS